MPESTSVGSDFFGLAKRGCSTLSVAHPPLGTVREGLYAFIGKSSPENISRASRTFKTRRALGTYF